MRINTIILILSTALGNLFPVMGQQHYEHPFQNPGLGTEKRIDNLLSLMTLDEKVKALSTNPEVPRLGVKGTGHVEGLHGLALGGPGEWGRDDPVTTTTFPQAYGLGEMWDPELLKKLAKAEAEEARFAFQHLKRGGLVVRAPNADLARDPRWGRTEESYGEDPFLTGRMTRAFVNGLQGPDKNHWRTASLMKHFLANSNEDGRTYTSSDFDERLLQEYYAHPFRMGVETGSRAFMAAYNKINGIPGMVHPILENLAVEQWGQNGIICTDGGAFKLLLSDHHYYKDKYHGAAAALKAGINQFLDEYVEAVYGALANGYLQESDIDQVIRGNYRVMIKLGMLDPHQNNPYATIGTGEDTVAPWSKKAHRQLAREATRKSIVLLKNENQLLPLNSSNLDTIALIGPRIDQVLLDWYSGTPPYTITPLEGLKNKLDDNTTILTAKNNADGKAFKIAKKADVALVLVGNHPTCDAGWADCPVPSEGKESVDRQSLELEYEGLVKLVYQANPKTVVSLISSFPYAINWTQNHVPAIVHMAQNSQELGNGLADVLFGDYNPAGRLTQTWVKSMTDLPDLMDYNIRHGRTYRYFKGDPLYAFGYGLSYASFDYKSLHTDKLTLNDGEVLTASVEVANTSDYKGEEVVQLYVNYIDTDIKRPQKALKAFKRVMIPAQATKTVELSFSADQLRYWNAENDRYELENGRIEIQVGPASDNIKLTQPININN